MASRRIPLFPLEVVLLPGNLLPLHIFEDRYREMIGYVVEHGEPFGVVLAMRNSLATVGCTARVARIAKSYEDGRMDIESVGHDPYRIVEVHQEKAYLEATAEILEDDPHPGPESVSEALRTAFTECHLLLHGSPAQESEHAPGASLAYHLAGELPLALEAAQLLLETRSEAERRTQLVAHLNELIPKLVRSQYVKSRASSNGHGLH